VVICADAVEYVKEVLESIQNSEGRDNIDDMLRQAEAMLDDINSRDFTDVSTTVQLELNDAIEGETRTHTLARVLIIIIIKMLSLTSVSAS
jgi:hypothetical protein